MGQRRRDSSLLVALCASLVGHAGVSAYLLTTYADDLARLLTQGRVEAVAKVEAPPIYLKADPMFPPVGPEEAPPPPPPPPPPPEPVPAKVAPAVPELPEPPPSEAGEADGTGDAMRSSAGAEPMLAPKGDETQAFLSRDPEGNGSVFDLPSAEGSVMGEGGKGVAEARLEQALSDGVEQVEPVVGVPAEPVADAVAEAVPVRLASASPVVRDVGVIGPVVAAPEPEPEPEPEPAKPEPVAPAEAPEPAAEGDGKRAGSAVASADPAPASDSEMDAFSKTGAIEFRQGKIVARFGRKVKTTRPRLTLAARYDLASLPSPVVVLKVKIDATGRVTSVEVLRSSGSEQVDLPVQVAVYDWWIEPPKDAGGNAVADVMIWRISFR